VSYSIVDGGYAGGTNINVDPKLSTLGNYGGFTQTIPLLPGSSAIDATSSNCPAQDQRGKTRSTPNCDIGAFESQGFNLAITGGNNQHTLFNSAFTNPLVVGVTAINAVEPVNGGLVTFTAPASGANAILTGSPATISGGSASVTAAANETFGTYQVTASAIGAAVNANFDLENTQNEYSLTITSAHGTVARNPDKTTYHEGDVVQLTATPNTGWSFANWTGDLTGTVNPDSVTIHGDTSVTANYTQNTYRIYLPLVIR